MASNSSAARVLRLPARDGCYRTPPGSVSCLARISPGLVFYPRVASVVWRASAKAKRGRYDDHEWSLSSLHTLRALEAAGIRFDISGLDHIQAVKRPCVFIANHMSTLETFILPIILLATTRLTFVVKQSLIDYPVFGHVMRSRDPIAVGRANPREDLRAVLDGGVERLGRGLSIVIFPQTTRTPRFSPAEFNSIGIKLAKKADAPVIPIALKTDAWGNGRVLKDCGKIDPSKRVHFAFGSPLHIQDRGNQEHEAIIGFIRDKLMEWGGEVAG